MAFTWRVQFQLSVDLKEQQASSPDCLWVGERRVPLAFVRHPRARRYVLRLRRNGVARVTIPRGGSMAAGKAFAERQTAWVERQLQRLNAQPDVPTPWQNGSEILFRGQVVRVEVGPDSSPGIIYLGDESIRLADSRLDLRSVIQQHLRGLAHRELPPRVMELAALHHLVIRRVSVRNQKTRWGSCSRRGTVSLNWRLIQAPVFVRDYVILHELMHMRQMNHSSRFWRQVEQVCPDYKAAELWLKQHAGLLN